MIEETCCFTGNRKIPEDEIPKLKRNLKKEIKQLIKNGYKYFMCGGELGFDTLAALAVIELKKRYKDILLIMVIPYRNQACGWKDEDILLYNDIIAKADDLKILTKVYYKGAMQVWDRYIKDNSNVCITYNGKTTDNTTVTMEYIQNDEFGRKIECIML